MSQTAKSWNIVSQEKIQKFIHNTRSSFEPIDFNGMTDIYLLLTGVLGKSQNGCFNKKKKHAKFSGNRTFLTPWYAHVRVHTCVYQRVRNVRFSENLACFVFLKQPFWDSPFCLITGKLKVLKQASLMTKKDSMFTN